ncbi:MAG TPA: hypothetical protein VI451_14765, partial [Anaerolineales bacterium]|nr:hypothetical protein [Anaerolineales bacterium]
ALAQLASVADAPPASVPTAAPLTQFPTPTDFSSQTPLPPPTETPTETPIPTLTSLPTSTSSPIIETTSITNTESTGTQTITPSTPLPIQTPTATESPPPTLAPTATSASPYILDQRTLLCEPDLVGPLLIVRTLNKDEIGIPGVEIILNWPNGEEHFFTGLKPELGLGYADFAMTPDISYTLRLADGSQLITDLTASECQAEGGQTIWGSWELIFIQP